ncbi:MAG: hypothetical protein DSZ23_02985 [Thermodesulfatator sp.]|nr:MAG: hypothetical protein DSZ23_02985 [Thermodesulfatator sp.]
MTDTDGAKIFILETSFTWTAVFWAFVIGLTVFRLWFLYIYPYDLSPDEAYYWDWSRHLSWGYYSKPPMVAWVMALFCSIFGNTAFAVRLPAVLFSSLTLCFLFFLGTRMFDARTGFYSAIVFFGTIGSAVASMIMTIDAPLLCFWSSALFLVWRAWEVCKEGNESSRKCFLWWAAAGAVTGFGLLSKQTMAGFTMAVMIFLVGSRQGRRMLLSPGPWIFIISQALLMLPVIIWNQCHGWVTLEHTAHHFESATGKAILNFKTFFELLGTQSGIVTPVTFVLALVVSACFSWRLVKNNLLNPHTEKHAGNMEFYLLASGFLPIIAVFLLSFRQRINANWPAPFYLSLGILISAWALGKTRCGSRLDGLQRFFQPGLYLGIFLVCLLYLLPAFMGLFDLYGTKLDPTKRLRGWSQLGMAAGRVLEGFPRPDKTFVISRRRQTVSELAFYMPGQPNVYRWSRPDRPVSTQYELWPGPTDKKGWDALIIFEKHRFLVSEMDGCFSRLEFIKQMDIPLGNGAKRSYMVYRGIEMKNWPER